MKRKAVIFVLALGLAKSAGLASTGEGKLVEKVCTTAYTYGADENGDSTAKSAVGKPLKSGKVSSAAADWSRWPVGTHFRIVETGQEYVVDDYGRAMIGTSKIDLFKSSHSEMNHWGVRKVTIEILEWGSVEKSIQILASRKGGKVREMREALIAQGEG
jgi:3D (Asp-Asp-Asp) domain-containing protein